MLIAIVLDFKGSKLDPEELRSFWSSYIDVLPYTGMSGMPQGQFKSSGVSVYKSPEELRKAWVQALSL